MLTFSFGVSIESSDSFATNFECSRPLLIIEIAFVSLANSLSNFSLFSSHSVAFEEKMFSVYFHFKFVMISIISINPSLSLAHSAWLNQKKRVTAVLSSSLFRPRK